MLYPLDLFSTEFCQRFRALAIPEIKNAHTQEFHGSKGTLTPLTNADLSY